MKLYHRDALMHPVSWALRAVDIEQMKRFYSEGMGFKLISESEKEAVLSADGSKPILTLLGGDIEPKPNGRAGLYHIAILLPSRRDLGSFIRHIMDYGAKHIGGSNHGVSEAFYMEDPEGNGIEVYADIPDSKWEFVDEKPVMFTEPLDYRGLLQEAEGHPWEGMPEDTIIGHIHLHVGDLDKAERFYEALGFELVYAMAASAYFMSTGGYHHHIGFNVWNGRGAKPAPENASGLDHFVLNAAGQSLVEIKEKLEDAGYDAILENGKLKTKDPSGNGIVIKGN
ncbi:MAG: VOC family protein [Gudongella sp.]|jgi:catechol 2,3-dioxygenase|nr:VOC family protein [Gudongella sp.]